MEYHNRGWQAGGLISLFLLLSPSDSVYLNFAYLCCLATDPSNSFSKKEGDFLPHSFLSGRVSHLALCTRVLPCVTKKSLNVVLIFLQRFSALTLFFYLLLLLFKQLSLLREILFFSSAFVLIMYSVLGSIYWDYNNNLSMTTCRLKFIRLFLYLSYLSISSFYYVLVQFTASNILNLMTLATNGVPLQWHLVLAVSDRLHHCPHLWCPILEYICIFVYQKCDSSHLV